MSHKFKDLAIFDIFNTKVARWVKTGETKAMCVFSAVVLLGSEIYFNGDTEDIELLYSSVIEVDDEIS